MFGVLLKKYRKIKRITQLDLANNLTNILGYGINAVNVTSWERGVNPKIEVIIAIAEILEIPEQFLFNDSKDSINKIISKEMPNFENLIASTKKISLIGGYVGTGSCGIIEDEITVDSLYVDISMISKSYRKENIKGLTVIGDSMYPYVNCNDIVLFAPVPNYKKLTDGKYIITTVTGTQLKNLSFRSNGDILITSCNSCYPAELIKYSEMHDSIDITGIVVGRILKS